MATRAAKNRLTREYKTISANPPPYIVAHPSESNILEWHYIITGPEKTPYHSGQYWGVLMFPPDYPFAPPSIKMHTPSGRFQPSTRLCLSISDFHPKSFNPAWEVSTILIGLLSFMTSEEMTTGSVGATEQERRWASDRSRWWNSTGGGSHLKEGNRQKGNIKAGDGGAKFREEWPETDSENWRWMRENNIDPATGEKIPAPNSASEATAQMIPPEQGPIDEVIHAARLQPPSQSWVRRNKLLVAGAVVFFYVMVARILGRGPTGVS